ncbi:MAG: methyltransferase domain-containing protein [Candidatus Omnitrophota bacterium]
MPARKKQSINTIVEKIGESKKRKIIIDFFSKDIENFDQSIKNLEKKTPLKSFPNNKICLYVFRLMNKLLDKARVIEEIISDKTLLKAIKQAFREQIEYFLGKSTLMRWGYYKPSGHPGDYELIEAFYDNMPLSKGIGFCGDKYILQDGYVEAVKIRKDLMLQKLASFIKDNTSKHLNIMNLGCGSSREIRELFSTAHVLIPRDKRITFTLIDWDEKALEFSKQSLLKYRSNDAIEFIFFKINVLDLYKNSSQYTKALMKQDLIYSIGLADYMPNLVFGEIIKFCFSLLKKKGTLTIAHKNIKVHKSVASDWACDWHFYPRSIEDVIKIIDESFEDHKRKVETVSEKTKHIFFVDISKP